MTASEAINLRIIGEHSFANCVLLSKVSIPESVQIVKEYAFASCPNLANMTIEDMLTQSSHIYLLNGVLNPTREWSNDVVFGQNNLVYQMTEYQRTVSYEIPVYVRDLDGKWGWNTITITTKHGYFAARSIQLSSIDQELNILGTDTYKYENVDVESDETSYALAEARVQNIAKTCFRECFAIFYDLREDSVQRKWFNFSGKETTYLNKDLPNIRITIKCTLKYSDGTSSTKNITTNPKYEGYYNEFVDENNGQGVGEWILTRKE